jgi:hypothetical protein
MLNAIKLGRVKDGGWEDIRGMMDEGRNERGQRSDVGDPMSESGEIEG